MQKFKKIMAVALSAAMVIGSSITAFADEAATSGSSQGTGTSEGHLDTHVVNVVLPTVPADSTPFAYTMDLERLIQQTNGAKYGAVTFPNADDDKGVYFLVKGAAGADTYTPVTNTDVADISTYYEKTDAVYTKTTDGSVREGKTYYTTSGDATYTVVESPVDSGITNYYELTTPESYAKTEDTTLNESKTYYTKTAGAASTAYANTSEALTVTSKSSVDINLKVEVAASSAATDVPLVATADGITGTDPKLYLALQVGSDTVAIEAGKTVSKEVTISGKDENFEATYDTTEGYVYTVKDTVDDETGWNSASFSLTGAATTATSAEGLTAPTLTVTWSWTDPTDPSTTTPTGTDVSAVAESGSADLLVRLIAGQSAVLSNISSATVNGTAVPTDSIAVSGSGNVWLKNVVSGAGTYNIVIVYDGVTYIGTYTKS